MTDLVLLKELDLYEEEEYYSESVKDKWTNKLKAVKRKRRESFNYATLLNKRDSSKKDDFITKSTFPITTQGYDGENNEKSTLFNKDKILNDKAIQSVIGKLYTFYKQYTQSIVI